MKEDILNTYDKVSNDYGYNSNSLHKLGLDARKPLNSILLAPKENESQL